MHFNMKAVAMLTARLGRKFPAALAVAATMAAGLAGSAYAAVPLTKSAIVSMNIQGTEQFVNAKKIPIITVANSKVSIDFGVRRTPSGEAYPNDITLNTLRKNDQDFVTPQLGVRFQPSNYQFLGVGVYQMTHRISGLTKRGEMVVVDNDVALPDCGALTGTMSVSDAEFEKVGVHFVDGKEVFQGFHAISLLIKFSIACKFNKAKRMNGTISVKDLAIGDAWTPPDDIPVGEADPGADPGIPTADQPRDGLVSLVMNSDVGATLGNIGGGKTYRISQNDGPWFSELRDPSTVGEKVDFSGGVPDTLKIRLLPVTEVAIKGFFNFGVQMNAHETNGFEIGKHHFELGSVGVIGPEFVIQNNTVFCAGGVVSDYTIDDYAFNCEYARAPTQSGAVSVPHLARLKVTFKTQCTDEKGAFRGTLTVNDEDVGFDCGTLPNQDTPPTPPPTDTTGGTTPGDSGGTPSTPSTPSTPTTPTTPSNAPRIIVADDIRSNGIFLANGQSTTVNLSTFTPVGFNADVALDAFSQPDGLLATFSPNVIPAPGAGDTVLTISATADTRPQDYTIVLSASGGDLTSFTTLRVSLLCDPPTILGLNQPKSSTISSGSRATLDVSPSGSAPFSYQWFSGQSGTDSSPIAGATSRTFTTTLTGTASYWVRVSNPCGSVDSATSTVTVN